MTAAHTRRLHAPRGRQIGRAKAHAVHARAGAGDRLHVVDALGGLEDGVDEDGAGKCVLGLQLREELIQIVNVPRSLDLRQHDHVEFGAGCGNDFQNVVEGPGRVERVDAGPQPRLAEVVRLRHFDESASCGHLGVSRDRVLEIAEHHIDLRDKVCEAGADLLVVWRHEMDHALESCRQLAERLRCTYGQRGEMLRGRAYGGHSWARSLLRCSNDTLNRTGRTEKGRLQPQRRLLHIHCSGASRTQASN